MSQDCIEKKKEGETEITAVKNDTLEEEVFNTEYTQPTPQKPVFVPLKNGGIRKFEDQRDLGRFLIKEYNIRSPRDITSCSTCHR